MSGNRRKLWRRIEDAVTGRLDQDGRRQLFAQLREEPAARADYDLTFEALRALEQAPVAQAELDVVEDWLMHDLVAQAEPARVPWWRRAWVPGLLAVGAAMALVLTLRPSGPAELPADGPLALGADGFQARGAGNTGLLAIDALCPRQAGVAGRGDLVPAAEYGCGHAGTVSFAYRVDPVAAASPGTLSLFGVDEAGDVLYYAPTPADPAAVDPAAGTWTPLPMAVQLDVNHEPGPVVVYGLLSPQTPTVAQIDAVARALTPSRPAGFGDPPWHVRLADTPALSELCPRSEACESAELSFTVHEVLP